MSQIIVLGGSGAVGSVAVKTLHKSKDFEKIIIGDYNLDGAKQLAAEMNDSSITACFVDALDPAGLRQVIDGCDIVLNCVGPFYNTVKPILEAVREKKINYVDVCDDVDVTLEILDMDEMIKKEGLKVVLGMGNSPGITNILGKLASDLLLDETHSIDIFHTHGGEKVEGEGVIGHRFHCMTIDCPMFLDGQLVYVKYFEKEGIALRQTFDFPIIGEVPIYPYPHPEQVTLPRYIQLKQVTNKGSVIPNAYYDLTRDLCGLGLSSKTSVTVKGQPVVPYDFAVAYILQERERMLQEAGIDKPRGCVSVIAKGIKDGDYKEFRFHLVSESEGLGEGTGIPAAVGAIMMNRGLIENTGVMPPEACVSAIDFLKTTSEVYDLTGKKSDSQSTGQVMLEMVDKEGHVTPIDVSQFGIF
ncbi:MAG: saccharopine dehydrogenase NADP-binding domain-containing protein [Candidatus Magnetomorum sp.]|nr:saccharopine dehydrogenase NADP-binding domain-containing protein [Candidatus Magnetomorum sp.]